MPEMPELAGWEMPSVGKAIFVITTSIIVIVITITIIIIRLEEAEKKRQAMVTAQKEKQEARGMVVEHRVGLEILHRNETLKFLLRCRR